jgi:hypothetical protein
VFQSVNQLWANDRSSAGRWRKQLREQEGVEVFGWDVVVCLCDDGKHDDLELIEDVNYFVRGINSTPAPGRATGIALASLTALAQQAQQSQT